MRELALIPKKKKLIQILRLFIREKIGIKNLKNIGILVRRRQLKY